MELGIRFGQANLASFPAIRAIVFAVHAHADTLLPLAVAAIPVALALAFGKVALRTKDRALHLFAPSLRGNGTTPQAAKPTKNTIGQPSAPEQEACSVPSNGGAPGVVSRVKRTIYTANSDRMVARPKNWRPLQNQPRVGFVSASTSRAFRHGEGTIQFRLRLRVAAQLS
jgi:hypothetical protein